MHWIRSHGAPVDFSDRPAVRAVDRCGKERAPEKEILDLLGLELIEQDVYRGFENNCFLLLRSSRYHK
ncbi:hypothetical protein BRADI_3g17922v3 [Brachypodium distachyon]|uniref:Uncharacterized protein n=1 Tax=Brachypodium distachyon TaxID=15368 RepID=A0A2K2CXW5_BRADI|nr:hypothetical protein BRADI_3g17922v3 [Brachypodium distachyon]